MWQLRAVQNDKRVTTLLWGIEPNGNMTDVDGQWILIQNVTDGRTRPLTNPVVEVEGEVLAEFSEYADISAVENDLEV